MGKGKLERFAENQQFGHVFEPDYQSLINEGFEWRGKWQSWFKQPGPITLELACGKGEYSLGLSERYPKGNFIGMDIKGARLWKGAKQVEAEGRENVAFLRQRIHLIPHFFAPEDQVSDIWIVFPDPQPREGKEKKRLTSPAFLSRYRSFLPPQGKIHLKTDSRMLFEYTESVLAEQGLRVLERSENVYRDYGPESVLHIRTFYESMWLEMGRDIHYLCFEIGSDGL